MNGRGGARDLDGALAVVTGAGSGIGRACALRFASRGATVVAVDIDRSAVEETCAEITGDGGRASDFLCDVSDAAAVEDLVSEVVAQHGPPAVLANVVGGAKLASVEEMDFAHWSEQLQLNLTSVYLMCHAVLPTMKAASAGAIVNTSSGWGFMPAPGRSAYAACKAGIVAFSRALATELAPHGIRVNVVAPGPIVTPRMRALTANDPLARSKHQSIPIGRLGEPDEVAAAVSFLASDDASYICGQVIHVNGGVFMP